MLIVWLGLGTETTWLGFRKHHGLTLDSLPALVATKMTGNVPKESHCSQPIGNCCLWFSQHPPNKLTGHLTAPLHAILSSQSKGSSRNSPPNHQHISDYTPSPPPAVCTMIFHHNEHRTEITIIHISSKCKVPGLGHPDTEIRKIIKTVLKKNIIQLQLYHQYFRIKNNS